MIIYLAINKINGKPYVGQTKKSLENRIFDHNSVVCKKYKKNKY